MDDSRPPGTEPASRSGDVLAWVWIGMFLAVVGLCAGLFMIFTTSEVICADGTSFAAGSTDHTCSSHPQAALGVGIAALSLIAGIVVHLVGMVAADTGSRGTPLPPLTIDEG